MVLSLFAEPPHPDDWNNRQPGGKRYDTASAVTTWLLVFRTVYPDWTLAEKNLDLYTEVDRTILISLSGEEIIKV